MKKIDKAKDKQKIQKIQVAIRVRPLMKQFQDEEAWCVNCTSKKIASIPSSRAEELSDLSIIKKRNTIQSSNIYEFTSDYIFSTKASNLQVYNQSCSQIIAKFCSPNQQTNGTIFMYGQTTSGKTYTMLGNFEQEGLISLSLRQIFHKIDAKNQFILISYFEIYNEQINDLLNPGSVNLKIIQDSVQGAKECVATTYEQAIKLLRQGEEQRAYSEKKYHDHSSRSHTIFQIKKIQAKNAQEQTKRVLNLVDLAGSERLGGEEGNDQTGYINKSLFTLSTVIGRLASSKKNSLHIPFRDSKLTRVLAPALMGNSRTVVICTVSPASINFFQTLSTLRFASCSRKVELKPLQTNTVENTNKGVDGEIVKLREENQRLKQKLVQAQKSNKTFQKKSQLIMKVYNQNEIGESKLWQNKVKMLVTEYQKNIKILQKEYTKAIVNAVSEESSIDKVILRKMIEHIIFQ